MEKLVDKVADLIGQIVRPSHFLVGVALISAALLFMPSNLAERLGVSGDLASRRFWIFVAFSLSWTLIAIFIVHYLALHIMRLIKFFMKKIRDSVEVSSIDLSEEAMIALDFLRSQRPDYTVLENRHRDIQALRLNNLITQAPAIIFIAGDDSSSYEITDKGLRVLKANHERLLEIDNERRREYLFELTGQAREWHAPAPLNK